MKLICFKNFPEVLYSLSSGRYIAITGQKPDSVTVGKIMETGESENFLQIAIHEQGWDQVLEAILEIKQRHDAVAEIAKSLQQLHQLFLDMEVHVKSQCEQLNDSKSLTL